MYQNPYFQQPQLRIILINSVDEANRIPADINGNPLFFYNKNSNEIYVKQFFMSTGLTTFDKYTKFDEARAKEKEEKDINIYQDNFNAINERLDGLYKMFEKKEGIKNAK